MIKLAATVLVIRDGVQGLEVLMVRRAARSSFMADAFVYPGGRIDDSDGNTAACFDGNPSELATQLKVDPQTALAIVVGAARETFEEVGILIARRRGERAFVDLNSIPMVDDWRHRIHAGTATFSSFLETENLVIDDCFTYFAHWTTPVAEKKRYNTFFFVVKAPVHQQAVHDEKETVDSLWCRPADALEQHRQRSFLMFPPTFRTLERLQKFDSTSDVFESNFDPPHILPYFVPDSVDPTLLLPGDPEFPVADPDYQTATPVIDEITRLVLRNGFWQHLDLEAQ